MPRYRHVPRALALGLLAACVGIAWVTHHLEIVPFSMVRDRFLDPLSKSWAGGSEALGFFGDEVDSGFCTVEAIVDANWEVREPLQSIEQMRAKYDLGGWHHYNCHTYALTEDGPTVHDSDFLRSLAVASPELVPTHPNCTIRRSSRRSSILRLLRMPMGMVLIGDSLTLQHLDTIDNVLRVPGGPVIVDWKSGINRTMSLDLSHPDTLLLAQEAGVPEERLSRPLVTWWRSNLLADPDELAVIFEPTGRFKLKFEAAIDWTTWLRDKWAEVPLVRSYASGVLEEPTVVVVEVGAHWWLSELGYQLTDEEMEIGYYAMVEMQEIKLRNMQIPMSLFWRTVSPPHIDCHKYNGFENERSTYALDSEPERKVYNYHFFPWMTAFLRERFPLQRARSAFDFMSKAPSATIVNPPFRLVDVWNMSAKRPEAHLRPVKDCLHWCMTGVLDHWHMLFWHMVFEESRNTDYKLR